MRPSRAVAGVLALLVVGVVTAVLGGPPARAAGLTAVPSFGSNPGALDLYVYRPDGLPAGAPVVVAMHGCTQTASDYYTNSGWRTYADAAGVAVLFPQQRTANNSSRCFNWFSPGDTARGQGEAASIASMLAYAVTTYGLDGARAFVTGLSAGGAMTAVMLATYPDRFAAGAVVAGLPYRCATDTASAYSCMANASGRTPAQWGDLVRTAYAYSGPRPRVAIWHGTADTTVAVTNADASRDQWTDVLGVDRVGDGTTTLPGNGGGATTRTVYTDGSGRVVVQDNRVAGLNHGTPVDPSTGCGAAAPYFLSAICSTREIGAFFGLGGGAQPTTSPTVSPTAGPSPTSSPSSPSPTAGPVECTTASNYAHVAAGRAYTGAGRTYANGSGQAMGLYTVFVTHTLRRTGPNTYVLADGGC